MRVFPFLKGLWVTENYSTCGAHHRGQLDLKVASLSFSVISKNSGLLIQRNYSRTEYLSGSPCVRLTVERERERESNPTASDVSFFKNLVQYVREYKLFSGNIRWGIFYCKIDQTRKNPVQRSKKSLELCRLG